MQNEKLKKYYNYLILLLSIFAIIIALLDMTLGLEGVLIYIYKTLLIFFIADYTIRLVKANDKIKFFKENIFDLIAILPFDAIIKINKVGKMAKMAKLVKISKLAKLSRFIAFLMRFSTKITHFFHTNEFKYTLVISTIIMITGTTILHSYENMPFLDSFWHAVITVASIGYGDYIPITTEIGKFTNTMLILTGIGVIGALSSTVTVFVVKENIKHHNNTEKFEIDNKNILMEKYSILNNESKEKINYLIDEEYKKQAKNESVI